MTGREKLIEWAKTVTPEHLGNTDIFCPQDCGLDNDEKICEIGAVKCGVCEKCWRRAIEKEYGEKK